MRCPPPADTPQVVTPEEYYRHSQQSLDSVLSEIQQQQMQQQQQHSQNDVIIGGNMYTVSTAPQGSAPPTPPTDPVYANRAALLPAYRPSPDYETVMRTRMVQQVHIQVGRHHRIQVDRHHHIQVD